jgi:hypothetical protein
MSNVIEIFPGLKEIEMSRFRQKKFRPGLINFESIDVSSEKKTEAEYKSIALNLETEEVIVDDRTIRFDDSELKFYDRNGKFYNLYINKFVNRA